MRQLNYIGARTLEWHDVPEPSLPSVLDESSERLKLVANAGELVWAPRGYPHTFHVSETLRPV